MGNVKILKLNYSWQKTSTAKRNRIKLLQTQVSFANRHNTGPRLDLFERIIFLQNCIKATVAQLVEWGTLEQEFSGLNPASPKYY